MSTDFKFLNQVSFPQLRFLFYLLKEFQIVRDIVINTFDWCPFSYVTSCFYLFNEMQIFLTLNVYCAPIALT